MLYKAMNWLRRLAGASPRNTKPSIIAFLDRSADSYQNLPAQGHIGAVLRYDQHFLERAKTQWQFGDWHSLAAMERSSFEHHPDRAKLVLLAAAGRLQKGNSEEARLFLKLAEDWGCEKRLIGQILIAGAHNSLGRVAASAGLDARAVEHFEHAINIGLPGSDSKLLIAVRINQQASQLAVAGKDISTSLFSIRRGDKTAGIISDSLQSLYSSTEKYK